METRSHVSLEIALPNVIMEGKDALNWFLYLRNQNIKFAENIKVDFRAYVEFEGSGSPRNMYQVNIYQWVIETDILGKSTILKQIRFI